VHQWKYREGEREEETKERRKIEREEEEKTTLTFNSVLHPPLETKPPERTYMYNNNRWNIG
jgi:hypothetical protein